MNPSKPGKQDAPSLPALRAAKRIDKEVISLCAAEEMSVVRIIDAELSNEPGAEPKGKDTERLDWLARNLVMLATPTSPDMSGIRYVGQLRNEARGSGAGPSYFRINHRDLREGIDAAMSAAPTAQKESKRT